MTAFLLTNHSPRKYASNTARYEALLKNGTLVELAGWGMPEVLNGGLVEASRLLWDSGGLSGLERACFEREERWPEYDDQGLRRGSGGQHVQPGT